MINPVYKTALLATAGVTVGLLPAQLTGGMAVQLRAELGFSVRGLGIAVALFFIASATTSSIAGRAVDRIGAYSSMQISSGMSAVCLLGIAGLAGSWFGLTLWLIIGGVASSMAFVTANMFLLRSVPAHRQGWAFAIRQAGSVLSPLLAGLAVPVVALTIGWRWAFAFGGIGALLLGGLLRSAFRRAWTRTLTVAAGTDEPRKVLMIMAAASGLGTAVATATAAFIVEFSVHSGLSETEGGLLLVAGAAMGLIVSLIAGAMADTGSTRPLGIVSALLAVGTGGHAMLAMDVSWLIGPATLLSFGTFWGWGGLFQLTLATRNPVSPGRAAGVTHTGTWTGAVVGPLVFGLVADSWSYQTAWLAAAICAAFATLLMSWSNKLLV